jgi:hypothetical protein
MSRKEWGFTVAGWIGALCVALAIVQPWSYGVHAQSGLNGTRPASLSNPWEIKPQVLTVSTAVNVCSLPGGPQCGKDVYLCGGDANTAATATTVSLFDLQVTPAGFLQAVPIAANTTYPIPIGPQDQTCRWFPGGLTVQAGNANALTVELSGKYWSGAPLF